MPDRIVRDELLTSERYWSVPESAQLLFHHLILVADDFGNCHASHFALRTKCFAGRHVDSSVIDKLLSLLADVDLLRPYQVGDVGYLHIPRFRQRLRITKRRVPQSPWDMEQELKAKHVGHMPDARRTDAGHASAEVKGSEGKGSESNRNESNLQTLRTPNAPEAIAAVAARHLKKS